MKKVIRLSEKQLVTIIKKVINEDTGITYNNVLAKPIGGNKIKFTKNKTNYIYSLELDNFVGTDVNVDDLFKDGNSFKIKYNVTGLKKGVAELGLNKLNKIINSLGSKNIKFVSAEGQNLVLIKEEKMINEGILSLLTGIFVSSAILAFSKIFKEINVRMRFLVTDETVESKDGKIILKKYIDKQSPEGDFYWGVDVRVPTENEGDVSKRILLFKNNDPETVQKLIVAYEKNPQSFFNSDSNQDALVI